MNTTAQEKQPPIWSHMCAWHDCDYVATNRLTKGELGFDPEAVGALLKTPPDENTCDLCEIHWQRVCLEYLSVATPRSAATHQ